LRSHFEDAVKNCVKALRAARGWSQAELADRLGVSRQTVNAIETGKSDPSLPLAMKLARLFGARVEDVFSLDEHEALAWDALDQHAGA
jgi:putative transcriptional regulator